MSLFSTLGMKVSGAIIVALLLMIGVQRIQIAAEKRHSVKIERRLVDTAAALDRLQAETAAKTELAQAQDAAHAARVERDQVTISQETLSAYQKELAALRARARRVRPGPTVAYQGGGGTAPVPGVPDTAGGADGAASEDGLPASDALIASEQALQLKALQDWLRGQLEVER